MTHEKVQTMIDQLYNLLEKEREALLVGNLDQMTRLVEQKESLIDALGQLSHDDHDDVAKLQKKMMRNHALLDGALQGIRRALSRIAAVHRVRRTLETYNEDGQKKSIEGHVVRQVERRA